jgi:nucleoid-associated protein YgaU
MALEKAIITNTVTNENIPVMFNPEEYTLNRDINYAQAAIPGLSAPVLQFVNGNMQTLEMELFLDTYEEHRVGTKVTNRAQEDVRKLSRQVTFTCVLARTSQKFVMFLPNGTPVRARLQVTFNEYRSVDLEAKEIKRETSDYSKRYEVSEGETLSSIATRTYGDPRLWRVIAIHNAIERPRSLSPGLRLLLPNLPYRDPDSGRIYA